ncbi:hypothetical protein Tco_1201776 [Tanacetum coccineum]
MSYNGLSCYLCGDPLDGILCRRCSCGWCGNKLDDGFCSYCASKAENSFAYDPNPNSFDNSPNFSYPPPQPQFETYSCELCGNDSHYGYDCPSRVPLVYEPEPCYNQNFSDNYYPQDSPSFSQQYLCCAYCGGPHFDYQCQPINETYYEPNPSYDSSGFDQPQPPQNSVDRQGILQALNKMQEELEEIKQDRRKKKEDMSIEEMRHEQQLVDYKIKDLTNDLDFNEWGSEVRKKEQAYNEERYSAARRRMLSITFDDEDDYIPLGDIIARYSTSKAITPDLPIEEPDNSLSMGDEHLDTTSSIENLVPIPSEFEGISDDTCDEPVCDDSSTFDALNDNSEILSDSNDDDSSSDDDDFEDVEFEEVNDVEQEEKEFDLEDILQIQDVILREKLLNISRLITNIESLKDNPNPIPVTDTSPAAAPKILMSLMMTKGEVEICLHFEPDAPVIDNFNELNDDQRGSEIDFSQNVEDDDSFTFVIRTFLPFLTYPEVSPLSCSTGSEDTIFDPGIST